MESKQPMVIWQGYQAAKILFRWFDIFVLLFLLGLVRLLRPVIIWVMRWWTRAVR